MSKTQQSSSVTVLLSSMKMALATFCSRILGLVREQVMAAYFGASGLTDAFLVAYRIPNLLRDLFAEGAFSSAFVPTFVEANNDNKDAARKLLWSLFILLGGITLILSALTALFTPELIQLFAPKFMEDPYKFNMAVNLTRIMAPFLFFISIAALFMGALNSLKIFFIPSLAPAFFNICMISSMLIMPYILHEKTHPIYSLGIGVLVGGLIQALVQFPILVKKGFGPTKPDKIFTDRSKKVVMLIGPGLIGFAATQINLIVNTVLATGTIVGAVSWLSYAFRLFQLPVGILGVSIGNSNLVHFSEAWKKNDSDKAKEFLNSSYALAMFLMIPALMITFVCAEEIVNVIFERGKFSRESTLMTAYALKYYALGLPFYAIYKLWVPTFYAMDMQRVPVICSILSILINIVFCVSMIDYGFYVLAIGTSISVFINSAMQSFILKKKLMLPISFFVNAKIFKVIFGTLLSFALLSFLKMQLSFLDYGLLKRCLTLAVYFASGLGCYAMILYALGERELVKKIIQKLK